MVEGNLVFGVAHIWQIICIACLNFFMLVKFRRFFLVMRIAVIVKILLL